MLVKRSISSLLTPLPLQLPPPPPPPPYLPTLLADGIPEAAKPVLIHHAQFGIYTFLAGLGIIFAVVCFIFNIVFRKKQ